MTPKGAATLPARPSMVPAPSPVGPSIAPGPKLEDRELGLFAQYVAELTGIALDPSKRYLLESRLGEVLKDARLGSYAELYQRAKTGPDRSLERRIIDAVSTHETSFFRDAKVFELVKHKLAPEHFGKDLQKPYRIWSAACSTGQEAYSLTIALQEILFDVSASGVKILGTDISEGSVNAANKGEFSALEVGRGLDPKTRDKHFRRVGELYRIADPLRSVCRFQVDNLMAPRTMGPFDLILCRNVLIYFSQADKVKVLGHLLSRLAKTGALLVGSTESLLGLTDRVRRLEFHGATYYVPAG